MSDRLVLFGDFELDRQACELRRGDERIRLQIQPFRALSALLEIPGEVVTRQQLCEKLWPSNVYVDFDHGLNNAIARLREALEDNAEEPRYIETLPRVGYRFIHPVRWGEAASPIAAVSPRTSVPRGLNAIALVPRHMLALAVVAIVTLAGWLALGWSGAPPAGSEVESIAVLPLADVSREGDQEYFAAGLTDALIVSLAQIETLRIISDRSDQPSDAGSSIAVGRRLGVDAVMEGSVVRDGEDLRFDVRLVRTADGANVWARSYHGRLGEVVALQSAFARDVAEELALRISSSAAIDPDRAVSINPEAYDAYLRARHLWKQRNKESVARSIDYLREAIALEPDFAAAHAALAGSLVAAGGDTVTRSQPAEVVLPEALAAALEAIRLDESLAEGHAAYAGVLHKLEPVSRENDEIIEHEYERALGISPGLAEVRLFYGNFLSSRGRSDEAIPQYREALRSEPLNSSIMSRLAMELIDTGVNDIEAMSLFDRALELDPWQYNARVRLGWAKVMHDDFASAKEQFDLAEQISPGSPFSLTGQAFVAARLGDPERAQQILKLLKPIAEKTGDPFHVAIVYLGLRDKEPALEWLARAAGAGDIDHRRGLFALDSPLYDWLRDDPRFTSIRNEVAASRGI